MPTEAQQLQALAPLIRHVARPFVGRLVEEDDAIQVAAIGALHAIRTHDPGRGIPLATYVAMHARWAIQKHVRDEAALIHVPHGRYAAGERVATVSLNRPLPQGEAGDVPGDYIDFLTDETDPYAETHALDAIRRLPRREAIAVLAGQLGISQDEIAPMLGLSQMQVSRIQRAGYQTLRAAA